jgi:hypothetical protein
MSDFSPHLRQIAQRLPIREPARSRVLLEIATDMEDLHRHFVAEGLDPENATGAVLEQFDLSDEALADLSRIHGSPLNQSLDGLSGQARSTWERVVLALVALAVIPGLVGGLVLQPTLLRDASALVYPLAGLLVLGIAVGLWNAMGLFGPGRASGSIPRKGIRALPMMSLLLLFLGFSGIWVELYRSALAIRVEPALALRHLVGWLHLASATMVVALSGALLLGLLWFFLETRATHLDELAAARILEPR